MITSAQNPKIKMVQSLLARHRERQEQNAFVIEGVRLCEEARQTGWIPSLIIHSAHLGERGQKLLHDFHYEGVDVEEITERLMETIADTESPQGLLAVVPNRSLSLPDKLDFIVIADELRDPGNLGTLLRTAAAAGVQLVILTPGTTDAFSPKVLRSAMGAHFRLPIFTMNWDHIANLCTKQDPPLNLWVAESASGTPCWDLDLRQPFALVIGGEADGASQQALRNSRSFITIPMPGQSESLNAAVAAGVLMFEVVRQRKAL